MPLECDGGQSQFIVHASLPQTDARLSGSLDGSKKGRTSCYLESIAQHTAMSVHTLNRRFREQTGL